MKSTLAFVYFFMYDLFKSVVMFSLLVAYRWYTNFSLSYTDGGRVRAPAQNAVVECAGGSEREDRTACGVGGRGTFQQGRLSRFFTTVQVHCNTKAIYTLCTAVGTASQWTLDW